MVNVYDLDTDNDKLVFPFIEQPFEVFEGMRISMGSPIGLQTVLLIKAGLLDYSDWDH